MASPRRPRGPLQVSTFALEALHEAPLIEALQRSCGVVQVALPSQLAGLTEEAFAASTTFLALDENDHRKLRNRIGETATGAAGARDGGSSSSSSSRCVQTLGKAPRSFEWDLVPPNARRSTPPAAHLE